MAEAMENNFLEGNGIIILLLFFLMFGWGGNNGFGFGNNAAFQGAVTRAEMADAFNMSEVQRNQADIKDGLCALNNQIMQNRYDTAIGDANISQQIAENRYAAQLQAQNAQAQMANCCCEIKTALHSEGEATRALIQQNVIQELRDNLQAAQLQLGNVAQTQNLSGQLNAAVANIYNTMGRWYANPPHINLYGNGCGGGCNTGCGCGAYTA